jgi:hypothetical protein
VTARAATVHIGDVIQGKRMLLLSGVQVDGCDCGTAYQD